MMCFLCSFSGLRLRAGRTDTELEELARRARKLQGDRLGLEDFAQFLDLPVTDTLAQVHSQFDQVNTDTFKVKQTKLL